MVNICFMYLCHAIICPIGKRKMRGGLVVIANAGLTHKIVIGVDDLVSIAVVDTSYCAISAVGGGGQGLCKRSINP